MRALEFKSKIKNNQILIPNWIQSEFKDYQERNVRVIVLIEDTDTDNDLSFQKTSQQQLLNGYSDSDSIYDNN